MTGYKTEVVTKKPSTRQEYKSLEKKKASPEQSDTKDRRRLRQRIRLFPIWFRLLALVLMTGLALIAGAMIGYGVVGDGHPMDVLQWSTWQHIIDLVVKESPSA
ncbi:DNA-directed RNA polymerase subunit beta [Bacillaceae bacterium SIJ1]|nr:DNA-directed RNA polymerase subunit beta [Litoribacterium kuwaitense]